VIVEDDAPTLGPGQMRKREFVSLLQTTTCSTADAVLESVGHTTKGCPYIKRWLGHYKDKDAAHLMRAMHKYAPETVRARSAHEAIALVNQRVERAALSWAKTGKVTDLPEGIQEEMSGGGGGGFLGAVMGFAHSGFGSALLGFLGGGGGEKKEEKGGKASGASGSGVQRKSRNGAAAGEPDAAAVKQQLGSGQALDGGVQSRMGAAFGYDFSGVRVHSDARAGELSGQLNARAFTIGSDVAFAGGEYQPGTLIGDALIAHELAHVVQQGGGKQAGGAQSKDASLSDDSRLEQEADRSAVGAVVSAWTGAKKGLAEIGANALPRLKSGLKLQKCNCNKKPGEAELQKYLETLDKTDHVELSETGASKAREVVRHWQKGDASYILTARRKALLIQQILQAGPAGNAFQEGILDLLAGTGGAEFERVLQAVGEKELRSKLTDEHRKTFEELLREHRKKRAAGVKPTKAEAHETFDAETALEAEKQFQKNADLGRHSNPKAIRDLRQNCIQIVKTMAPQLLASEPGLAARVTGALEALKGKKETMTNAANAMADLGAATGPIEIPFADGNGLKEAPERLTKSAWDRIISLVGKTEGWHIFGLAPFMGYHSVTVFVDNRPDGPRVYWADQWALETPREIEGGFFQEPGSVSGFRRYEKEGFDKFIEYWTNRWWNEVHSPKSKCATERFPKTWQEMCKWPATLQIWHFHHGK
jgi:hypothetical protein